jgi:pimeloyl-ACP methyl ester carboxylesterase
MRTVSPQPPSFGEVDGLAYALFDVPTGTSAGGVVILHGADSCKESHFDFARLLHASGVASVCFDARGHGESAGAFGAGAVDDVVSVASVLPSGPVALRGSSMGGWLALAAALPVRAAAVVAICPAPTEHLVRRLHEPSAFSFARDADGFAACAERHGDLERVAAELGPRLMLLHAEGDETVPVEVSRTLHAAARGSRFVEVPGGHHRSVQHDPELQALALRFLQGELHRAALAQADTHPSG